LSKSQRARHHERPCRRMEQDRVAIHPQSAIAGNRRLIVVIVTKTHDRCPPSCPRQGIWKCEERQATSAAAQREERAGGPDNHHTEADSSQHDDHRFSHAVMVPWSMSWASAPCAAAPSEAPSVQPQSAATSSQTAQCRSESAPPSQSPVPVVAD